MLAAVISTPLAASAIAATRLRGGNAASARGAASFAAGAIATAREAGCTGTIVVRMDSAYYAAKVIAAIRRAGARFSVTVPMDPKVKAAIAAIPGDAWTAIKYSRAIWDDQLRAWISDAEVAEAEYTAFTSKKGHAVTVWLIVRRVRDLNKQAATGQDELFPCGGTTPSSPTPRLSSSSKGQHRDHAIVEQVFADVTDGPPRAPALRLVCRQRRVAGLRCHRAQRAARRRIPGQPRLREGPRRHAAPRPDQRGRPHRPVRPRPPHAPPSRRLAPRTPVDDPVRRLRAACPGGLTSPDSVTAPLRPSAVSRTPTPSRNPGQVAEQASGGSPRPIHCQDQINRPLIPSSHRKTRPVDRGFQNQTTSSAVVLVSGRRMRRRRRWP